MSKCFVIFQASFGYLQDVSPVRLEVHDYPPAVASPISTIGPNFPASVLMVCAAASVFIAFPEASRWIVTAKPGLKDTGVATVLTGCNYQVPGLEELEAEVEVVDVTTEKNGKQWVRKAICGAVDGQLPPQSDLYPRNMIGLIAVNADQPEKGAYFARIKKVSSGAWKCVLVCA
jgi:hypothetical protein